MGCGAFGPYHRRVRDPRPTARKWTPTPSTPPFGEFVAQGEGSWRGRDGGGYGKGLRAALEPLPSRSGNRSVSKSAIHASPGINANERASGVIHVYGPAIPLYESHPFQDVGYVNVTPPSSLSKPANLHRPKENLPPSPPPSNPGAAYTPTRSSRSWLRWGFL